MLNFLKKVVPHYFLFAAKGTNEELVVSNGGGNPLDYHFQLEVAIVHSAAPTPAHYCILLEHAEPCDCLFDLAVDELLGVLFAVKFGEFDCIDSNNVLVTNNFLRIYSVIVFLVTFSSVIGLVGISLRVEPSSETCKSNGFVAFHLFAEKGESVEFGADCEHYLFLHAPVT